MTASAIPSSATCHNPASNRRTLPIEEALRWAIRDELPKRQRDSAASMPSIHPMWANGLFTRVDNWSREPGMPLAMGECHPDAEVIEAAIAALKPDELDLAPYRIGLGLGSYCEVERICGLVRRDAIAWLITFAKKGGRPDTGGHTICEPVLGGRERPALWLTVSTEAGTDKDGRPWFITSDQTTTMASGGKYRPGTFCKLHWTRDADDVAEDRARYAVWHAALCQLTAVLARTTRVRRLVNGVETWADEPMLSILSVKAPRAPATPWISEPTPPSTLRSVIPPNVAELDPTRHPVLRPKPRVASPVRRIDPSEYSLLKAA